MSDPFTATRHNALPMNNHAEEIHRKYAAAKTAVAELAGEVGKAAAHRAENMKSHATDWVENQAKIFTESAANSQAAMISLVRKNPYKSLAVAALAGLVLGMLIHRR